MNAGMLTVAQAANYTGRSATTIRHWCRYGAIAATKTSGRWGIQFASLINRLRVGIKPARTVKPASAPIAPPAPVVRAAASWRKTGKGEWVVMAAAEALKAGGTIEVAKRDGTRQTVTIERVGKPFTKDGRQMAYAYPAKEARTATASRKPARSCDECGEHRGGLRFATDSSGLGGYVCSRCYGPSYMLSFA